MHADSALQNNEGRTVELSGEWENGGGSTTSTIRKPLKDLCIDAQTAQMTDLKMKLEHDVNYDDLETFISDQRSE